MPTVWTPDEIAQVRAGIIALATGTRVVTVTYAGPPARSIEYTGSGDLDKLRSLLAEMVASTAGTTYRLGATNKGLGR